ncbi:ImmA/IrrE family metallo-endopeptidase [Aquimarina rubra]
MKNNLRYNRGSAAAKDLLEQNGFDNLLDFPLDLFASGLGATVIEKELLNSDGRIIFGKKHTIIEINEEIEFEQKKRFTLAHEIGHLVLHKGIEIHNDNESTTSWFNNKEKQARNGRVEYEANQFASELLIPSLLFIERQEGKKFSPQLLRDLAVYFKVSITAIAFKYFQLGDHPICLFHSHNKKVSYWMWPDNYPHYIIDRTRLTPPEDSVAMEFFEKGKIYSKHQSKQQIWKSTWFDLKSSQSDTDFNFYEYCIVSNAYNSVLSVVWEE